MNNKFVFLIGILTALIIFVYDQAILSLVGFIRFDFLTRLMVVVSSTIFFILILIIYSILLRKKKEISLLWKTVVITYIISYFFKFLFKIPRPVGVVNELGYSFPSTHAMVIFSTIAVMGARFKKFNYVFLLVAVLIIFSRLYLGVHYLSDLFIGGVFGYLIGSIITKKWK